MIKNMRKDILLSKEEILFYIAWILFLIAVMFNYTGVSQNDFLLKVTKLIRYGAYTLCLISIYQKFLQKGKLLGIIGMAIVLILSFLGSSNISMFLYIFLIVAASGLVAKNVVLVSFITMGTFWISVIISSQIGLVQDYIFDPGGRERHSLGFSWTTTGPILFFFLILQYIYLRKAKTTYLELVILEIVNYVLYRMTDSRMAFLLLSLFLLTIVFVKIGQNRWFLVDKFKWPFVAMPTIIASLSIVIHAFYHSDSNIWNKFNELLSGRLKLGKDAIAEYGYTLFGQKIEWIGFSLDNLTSQEYNYVDCSYLQLLLQFGLFFLILVVVLYSILIYKCIKQTNYYLLWAILFVLIISITEPRLMNLAFNPFPVIFLSEVEQGRNRL